jgi:hypothetical protein
MELARGELKRVIHIYTEGLAGMVSSHFDYTRTYVLVTLKFYQFLNGAPSKSPDINSAPIQAGLILFLSSLRLKSLSL